MSDQAARLRRMVESARAPATVLVSRSATTGERDPAASVPTGVVSFRPRPARARADAAPAAASAPRAAVRLARAVAVTSGKGGVGKSNLAVNLAVSLSRAGRKVCLLDADLGMANADVLCNITPRQTLLHVVTGQCRLADVMLLGPGGFRLIPGASGVAGMADLDAQRRGLVLEQLAALERLADDIIIDCSAGISANVVAFASAAHTTLVTTTPEPTAVTDAYGMIKTLLRRGDAGQLPPPRLVVNMAATEEEGRTIHERMNRVTRTFLQRSIEYGGAIPLDAAVPDAVRARLPFALYAPDGPATQAVERLARDLAGLPEPDGDRGFFRRLLRRKRS